MSDTQVTMPLVETVSRVANLLNTMESREMVAEQLGWSMQQLNEFCTQNEELFTMANEVILSVAPAAAPPTDIEASFIKNTDILDAAPTPEQVTRAIQMSDRNLKRGLRSIGLSEAEAEEAEALQKFNRGHFADSMDMISAHVLKTVLKLALQQRKIEERLAFIRIQLEAFGEFMSEERKAWVEEEDLLLTHYTEIGELVRRIQETWYKGSATLAVIRMRMKNNGGNMNFNGSTQRSNKPGFRPNQTITVEP
jgi:hypothetical protein